MKLLLALLLAFPVYAENNHGNSNGHGHIQHGHYDGPVGGSEPSVVSNPTATGGQASATGGSAIGKGGNAKGGTSIGGDVSINEKRSAPNVYAPSIQSTTPYLKCAPFGGSGVDGGIAFGWCWIQRDAWAIRTFRELRQLGLYEQAATARCSSRLLYSPFGSRKKCESVILEALRPPDVQNDTGPEKDGAHGNVYEVGSGLIIAEVDTEALERRVETLEAELTESRQSTARAMKRARNASEEAQKTSEGMMTVQMRQMEADSQFERDKRTAYEADRKRRLKAVRAKFQAILEKVEAVDG